MKIKLLSAILAATILGAPVLCPAAIDAAPKKKYTVYDRQVELRKKVAKAFKANELTAKEADKLNGELDDIDNDVQKMKNKNDGKLSYKDEGKVEKHLNRVSLSLQKYQLNKRVVPH